MNTLRPALLPPSASTPSVRVPAHIQPSRLDVAPLASVRWLRYVAPMAQYAGNSLPTVRVSA